MKQTGQHQQIWHFECRYPERGERECLLELYWEVALDPISDDWTPDDISADDLLDRWAREVRECENGLVPIHWSIRGPGIHELAPYQFQHSRVRGSKNFLTYFTWPEDPTTGEPLKWLELPVVDKLWDEQHCNKGGFIQQATGWKPSALQSHVFLDSLMQTRCRGCCTAEYNSHQQGE